MRVIAANKEQFLHTSEPRECPACWGNGYSLDRHEERVPCSICAETGKVIPYFPSAEVPTCPLDLWTCKETQRKSALRSANTPPLVCPRCGDEWRGQACVADCPLWKMAATEPTKDDLRECLEFWQHYSSVNEGAQDDMAGERNVMLDRMERWLNASTPQKENG